MALPAAALIAASAASTQESIKVALIQSMTDAFNTAGKAAVNGAMLYVQQYGDTVAGRKIQIIVKDDASTPDAARRLAQKLIVNDRVTIIGAGITPAALAIAPLVSEAKIPTVNIQSGASATVERSPYMVRTSFTVAQSAAIMADWAVKNGAKRIITLVNNWAPGLETEAAFKERVAHTGVQIVESLRVPLANRHPHRRWKDHSTRRARRRRSPTVRMFF
jgi:branched-chain amino acid transport system substrate-binding protein